MGDKKMSPEEIAQVVADALHTDPILVEEFKANPQNLIQGLSGNNNLSANDIGSVLGTLLGGSNEGSGMLGELAGTLLSGKKTASGEKNIVGEIIGTVLGGSGSGSGSGSGDIVEMIVGTLFGGEGKEAGKPASKTSKKTSKKDDGIMGTVGDVLADGKIDANDIGTILGGFLGKDK